MNSPAPQQDLHKIISQKRSTFQRWLPTLIVLSLLGGGAYAWTHWQNQQLASQQLPPFVTEPLKRGNIELTVTATGNLEPTNEVTVGSELSGTTVAVHVDSNDLVKKGQELAILDTSKLIQQMESSRAKLNSAKARVKQIEATVQESLAALKRLQELSKISGGKAVSQADLDAASATEARAKAELVSAQASVGEAEAQMLIQESDLSKAAIKSPIDGVVLSRNLEPGQTVAASFTAPELFVIAEDLKHMKLKVAIAEADIARVEIGQQANFTVDAWPDRSYVAKVTKVSFGSSVTDNVVTYETELEVHNEDLSLRPGMTATADIQVSKAEQVFIVPNAALRFKPVDPNQPTVVEPKKSFIQTLTPGPPRRGRGPSRGNDNSAPPRKSGAPNQIYVLKEGQPQAIEVKLGITDGRFTEVRAEALVEDLPIIIRATPPQA